MTVAFWACVALLLAGALLFVLPPLLRPTGVRRAAESPLAAYREQRAQVDAEFARGTLSREQHQQALAELQARVVEEVGDPADHQPLDAGPRSKSLVAAVALLIPAAALAVYALTGTPAALHASEPQQASGEASPHAMSREQIETMVDKLAEKLKKNPEDAAGWHMLARSYVAFDRLPEAAQAYERANQLAPGDPQILSDFADVLAMVNDRNLEGRPMQLLQQALKVDPKHPKSLSLAGTAAFNRGDFEGAANWWRQLLATVPPDSQQATAIRSNIAQADAGGTQVAARARTPVADNAGAAVAVVAAGTSIEGSVTVADALKPQLAPGATLFVYARPVAGGRMPLAILRVPAGGFPFRFRLDDSQAMTPQTRLSTHSEVMLVARISRSGNAMPQPGDLTGTLAPVNVGARDVQLVIVEAVK
ncbi:c-type cytochrome biogenesis protein CcmI [Ramlibacter sp.]|uniref:c-type cytochrome biogenesis protein CcmI n=1 Tax=Ramlibacter sp. TaxID=1917967 RepID=UPI00262BD64F|nr:c-type cytochrome biogenesis protein CcmI [Ramlibacter sp.]MDB5953714.1 c-type cytochrome biosis protein CcmI [Ramlibacter sp.]